MIAFNHRVLVLGSTGGGKSVLLNYLFSSMQGGAQRVLIDTKHEYALPEVEPVRDVESIDFTQPLIHYRDRGDGVDEMQELFAALHRRRRILACVHELSDVCVFHAGRTPAAFDGYVSKGRALGQGLMAGSQRPFNVPVRMRTEAEHIFVMARGFNAAQDNKAAGEMVGLEDPRRTAEVLEAGRTDLGDFAFLHRDRVAGTLEWCPPLSDDERSGIVVESPILY